MRGAARIRLEDAAAEGMLLEDAQQPPGPDAGLRRPDSPDPAQDAQDDDDDDDDVVVVGRAVHQMTDEELVAEFDRLVKERQGLDLGDPDSTAAGSSSRAKKRPRGPTAAHLNTSASSILNPTTQWFGSTPIVLRSDTPESWLQ